MTEDRRSYAAVLEGINNLTVVVDGVVEDISGLKCEVQYIKDKKFTIEEIGIGSFVGWVKVTVGIITVLCVAAGSCWGVLHQVNGVGNGLSSLNAKYYAHIEYLHKLKKR